MQDRIFCVYVDYTQEDEPRAFYVGKGTRCRANDFKPTRRNIVHQRIVKRYGLNRIVILETEDESFALQFEIEKIKGLKTFVYDSDFVFGANLTPGGDGVTGTRHSEESRKKISEAMKGHRPWSRGKKYNLSDESRQRILDAVRKPRSQETKEKMSEAHLGKKMSAEAREKMSLAKQGKSLSDSHKEKVGNAHRGKPKSDLQKQRMSESAKKSSVEQLDKDGNVIATFASIDEAQKATGAANISGCCRGLRKFSNGYAWRYTRLHGTEQND